MSCEGTNVIYKRFYTITVECLADRQMSLWIYLVDGQMSYIQAFIWLWWNVLRRDKFYYGYVLRTDKCYIQACTWLCYVLRMGKCHVIMLLWICSRDEQVSYTSFYIIILYYGYVMGTEKCHTSFYMIIHCNVTCKSLYMTFAWHYCGYDISTVMYKSLYMTFARPQDI